MRSSTGPEPTVTIRPIEPADDAAVAAIVRSSLERFGCVGPGYPSGDGDIPSMSASYPGGPSRYLVVEVDGVVRGGAGFGPLEGTRAADAICELRKMYLEPELHGRGIGKRLLAALLDEMRDAGYERAYLETTTQMEAAQRLYRAAGFVEIDAPMGETGHCRCDRRFFKSLYEHGTPS